MTEPTHGGYLVPVRVDPFTGDRSVLCFLDANFWGFEPNGWAIWCPACSALVSEILPGTNTIPDLESAPAEVSDPHWQMEVRLSEEHAAAMASQDEGWTAVLTHAARQTDVAP
ncbi:hypothetical protein [Knoellia sp. LjRoot47]|uniref:hypothetical protein n=1 Tax=Knoellia sp. LjRoot47 TaxID=3342330 RepID=UPI003ECD7171